MFQGFRGTRTRVRDVRLETTGSEIKLTNLYHRIPQVGPRPQRALAGGAARLRRMQFSQSVRCSLMMMVVAQRLYLCAWLALWRRRLGLRLRLLLLLQLQQSVGHVQRKAARSIGHCKWLVGGCCCCCCVAQPAGDSTVFCCATWGNRLNGVADCV